MVLFDVILQEEMHISLECLSWFCSYGTPWNPRRDAKPILTMMVFVWWRQPPILLSWCWSGGGFAGEDDSVILEGGMGHEQNLIWIFSPVGNGSWTEETCYIGIRCREPKMWWPVVGGGVGSLEIEDGEEGSFVSPVESNGGGADAVRFPNLWVPSLKISLSIYILLYIILYNKYKYIN